MAVSNTGRRLSAVWVPPKVPSLPQAQAPKAIFGIAFSSMFISSNFDVFYSSVSRSLQVFRALNSRGMPM